MESLPLDDETGAAAANPARVRHSRKRTMLATAALAVGMAAGGYGVASAATSSTTSAANTAAPSATASPAGAPNAMDGHRGCPGETLLTGSTASSVTAAAKAAVPGGTIIRVENDAQGAKYEAHVKKADGSEVTVKLDANFKVTKVEAFSGGHGRHGGPPPAGAPTGAPSGTPGA